MGELIGGYIDTLDEFASAPVPLRDEFRRFLKSYERLFEPYAGMVTSLSNDAVDYVFRRVREKRGEFKEERKLYSIDV